MYSFISASFLYYAYNNNKYNGRPTVLHLIKPCFVNIHIEKCQKERLFFGVKQFTNLHQKKQS